MYTDGASNERCFDAGVVLVIPNDHLICYAPRLNFPGKNNEAEFESLIVGLKIAKELKVKTLHIFCDSQPVVYQARKEFHAKGARLASYLNRVIELLSDTEYYTITHISKEKNTLADSLAKLASSEDA